MSQKDACALLDSDHEGLDLAALAGELEARKSELMAGSQA